MSEEYKAETIRSYDEFGKHYEKKFRQHFDGVQPQADRFIKKIGKGARILDLGSGPGAHASYFQMLGLDVLCIDLSLEMVMRCRQWDLEAKVGDIERLPELGLETHSFDGIWAYASLLHVPKSKFNEVLYQMSLLVKQEGYVAISLKEKNPLLKDEGYVEKKATKGTKRFFAHYGKDEAVKHFSEFFDILWSDRFPINERTNFLDFLLCPKKSDS